MKILFIHPSDELYGADRVLLRMLEALPTEVEIEVWLPSDVDYPDRALSTILRASGVRTRFVDYPVIRRTYLHPLRVWALVARFVKTIRRRPDLRMFDLVYLNTAATLAIAPLVPKSSTVALHLHEDMSSRSNRLILPLMAWVDRIAAVSKAVHESLPRGLRRRARVIYNGFVAPPVKSRRERDEVNLLLASRWNAWKGQAEFLRAWSKVDREDLKLTILGGPPVSGSSVDVEQIVESLPNRDRVIIAGEVDSVRPYLEEADLVVVPSVLPDPLPTIAIEALGAGRAVLASDVGGLVEIVDEACGWVFPSPAIDESNWVNFLRQLRREDLVPRGAAARAVFDRRFSAERFDREFADWIID